MAALFALIASVMWGTSDFLGGTLARKRKVIAVVAGSQALSLGVGIVVVVISGEWLAPWAWVGPSSEMSWSGCSVSVQEVRARTPRRVLANRA